MWVNLKNIVLNEKAQKVPYVRFTLDGTSRRGKSVETENRPVVARGWGEGGENRVTTNGDEVSLG